MRKEQFGNTTKRDSTAPRQWLSDARESVRRHPLPAAGIAAGVGFLLGGGIQRATLGLLVGLGARVAASALLSTLEDAAHRYGDVSPSNED